MYGERYVGLPWYDLTELRGANDRLWHALAAELRRRGTGGVPDSLERGVPYQEQWTSGRLLLGQSCGYDVAVSYREHLRAVATPVFSAAGCDGPCYRSYVMVREDDPARELADLRGRVAVVNNPTSHSGMNILRSMVAPLSGGGRFFSDVIVSGAHDRSVEHLASGAADVAAIDCVTHQLLGRHRPASLRGLRILQPTSLAPAPPFVTAASTPDAVVAELRGALSSVLAGSDLGAPLLLRSVRALPESAYAPMRAQRERALELGFGDLQGALGCS